MPLYSIEDADPNPAITVPESFALAHVLERVGAYYVVVDVPLEDAQALAAQGVSVFPATPREADDPLCGGCGRYHPQRRECQEEKDWNRLNPGEAETLEALGFEKNATGNYVLKGRSL